MQFRTEHIATVPHGYKVRTVSKAGHRVRIAFPPGRRIRGSGHVVEVLHPREENPCALPNPAELVVMTANPHPIRSVEKAKRKLELAAIHLRDARGTLRESRADKIYRRAMRGYEKQVDKYMHRNPSQLEQASNAYEEFHGQSGKHVDTFDEPSPRPVTLAELGDLIELRIKRPVGWKWGSLDFTGRGVRLAQNISGTQLYLVDGDQKVSRGQLTRLGADNSKEVVDLGEATYIAYRTRKAQVNDILATYEHNFGEESGVRPRLMYDRRGPQPRIYFAGGEYHVEARGIVN